MIQQHGTLEISRSRLAHNLRILRQRIGPEPKLCATIKANAYGHGIDLISPLLLAEGIRWCCVYSLDEAASLTRMNWDGILALAPLVLLEDVGGATEELLRKALAGLVRVNITDGGSARRLAAFARATFPHAVNVHVQVDAGLTRVGVEPREAEDLAELIANLPGLRLEGVFAHFSHGDVPRHGTIEQQLAILHRVADPLKKTFPRLMVHLQNSGGAWHVEPPKSLGLDMVRIGIAVYGLQPSTDDPIAELLPIARVTAPILALHERPTGTGVGYGHTFVTSRHSRLAIVPVGYADGYPRLMSNRSVAQVRGVNVPVVGRVSMDQIILDVTDVPGVSLGDSVIAVSWNAAEANSLDAIAGTIGTIGYELATNLGGRLRRVAVD